MESGYRIRISSVQGKVQYQVWRRCTVLASFNTRTEAKKYIDKNAVK